MHSLEVALDKRVNVMFCVHILLFWCPRICLWPCSVLFNEMSHVVHCFMSYFTNMISNKVIRLYLYIVHVDSDVHFSRPVNHVSIDTLVLVRAVVTNTNVYQLHQLSSSPWWISMLLPGQLGDVIPLAFSYYMTRLMWLRSTPLAWTLGMILW